MKGNKHKATLILGMVSLAFFSSYPFRQTFIGGLIAGGCGAAMIGGLADWFAVSALFRKPLGIPWRTAIVPRNREKIFQALVHMVENQLLVKENIKSRLHEYDIADIVVKVMIEYDGKNVVKRVLYSFIREIIAQVKPKELGRMIDDLIKETVQQTPIVLSMIAGIEWLIKKGYDEKLIDFFLQQCLLLVEHQHVNNLLGRGFIAMRQRYEQGMMRRQIFNQLLNLSAEEVGSIGQKALQASLTELQDKRHPLRQRFTSWLQQWLIEKKTDLIFQQKVEKLLHQLLQQVDISQYATHYIAKTCQDILNDNRRTVKWLEGVTSQFDQWIAAFAQNHSERENFDVDVKNKISQWLDAYHGEIGNIIMNNLGKFTDKMLVDFIESKVGNDLQMVRINGSVVGGLIGILLYMMTFWL